MILNVESFPSNEEKDAKDEDLSQSYVHESALIFIGFELRESMSKEHETRFRCFDLTSFPTTFPLE